MEALVHYSSHACKRDPGDPLSICACSLYFVNKDISFVLCETNMWGADTPLWALRTVAYVGAFFPCPGPAVVECVPIEAHAEYSKGCVISHNDCTP